MNKSLFSLILEQVQTSHVNWDIVNSLGYTRNHYGAGYIEPSGKMLDFSESNDGGDPSERTLDHRAVGGYEAMEELLELGYIRMGCDKYDRSGFFEIYKPPTQTQFNRMSCIFRDIFSVTIDLKRGKGGETMSLEFDKDFKPMTINNKIRRFFGQSRPR